MWEITRCALMRAPLFLSVQPSVCWMNKSDLFTNWWLLRARDQPHAEQHAHGAAFSNHQRGKAKRAWRENRNRKTKTFSLSAPQRQPCVYFCSVWLEKSRHRIWHPQLLLAGTPPRASLICQLRAARGWCNIHDAVHCGERGCCCVHTLSLILITTQSEKAHSLSRSVLSAKCSNFCLLRLFVVIFVGRRRLLSLIERRVRARLMARAN